MILNLNVILFKSSTIYQQLLLHGNKLKSAEIITDSCLIELATPSVDTPNIDKIVWLD